MGDIGICAIQGDKMSVAQIVSELGVNHLSSLETAFEMIRRSKAAGANYVKFQTKDPKLSVPEEQWNDIRDTPFGEMTKLAYRQKMEFTEEQYQEIGKFCKEVGIKWFSSAWDLPSLEKLKRLSPEFIKIPSARLSDDGLLIEASGLGYPVILSTGMSTIEQVDHAVELLGRSLYCLMHCNSAYPCDDAEINLRVIQFLKRRYEGKVFSIGFSSHSPSPFPAIYSILVGAVMVEVHFTLSRASKNSDSASSLEYPGLELVCREAKRIPVLLGDGLKRVYPSEFASYRRLKAK